MPISTARRVMPATRVFDLFQDDVCFSPGRERRWLQPELLGTSASEVLVAGRLKEEARQASLVMLTTLDLFVPRVAGERAYQTSRFAQRMETLVSRLRQYALGRRSGSLILPAEQIVTVLRDFMHFVAMAETACQLRGQATLTLLPHLIGLALVRYKIEAHWKLHGKAAMLLDGAAGQLSCDEIAAVCELTPARVRHAMACGDLHQTEGAVVPIPQALDWMRMRRRFLLASLRPV